jgi:Integrase zinc binding domain
MNLSDVQGRLARWRLRLAEFTFKVEYHPGVAHHAADSMSRLPHQAVPSDPIEEEIPVCAVAHEESQEPEFPTALEEVTSDPITEIQILHMNDLFESQCLDPTARRNDAARVHDPTWDYDRHGILSRRTPSVETEVYLPHTLRRHGPHAIIIPVARDGSDLRRGDTDNSIANSPDDRSEPKRDPPRLRLLTRGPHPTRERDTHVGLASLLEPNSDDRIPTGAEIDVATFSTEELPTEQAVDPVCKKLLLSADKSLLYELNDVGILVRKSPFDGSEQIVVPQSLVSRILYLEHYPPAAGHPGAHRMFQTIRKTLFWPASRKKSTRRFDNAIFVPGIVYRRKGKRTRSSSFPRTGLWSPLPWTFWDRSRGRNTETVFYW